MTSEVADVAPTVGTTTFTDVLVPKKPSELPVPEVHSLVSATVERDPSVLSVDII
jgi:hypothetical protein